MSALIPSSMLSATFFWMMAFLSAPASSSGPAPTVAFRMPEYSGIRKATVGAGPDELAGAERNAIIQKNVAESIEDGINADIDYERFFRKLPRLDQQILELTREGCQSDVIAKELHRDAH